jgi:Cu/Ag efflux protein CusF
MRTARKAGRTTQIMTGRRVLSAVTFACLVAFVVVPFDLVRLWPNFRTAPQGAEQIFPQWASPSVSREASTYRTTGMIAAIDPNHGSFTVEHGLVQGMGWPMFLTVRYVVTDVNALQDVAVGQRVLVVFKKRGADYEAMTVHGM